MRECSKLVEGNVENFGPPEIFPGKKNLKKKYAPPSVRNVPTRSRISKDCRKDRLASSEQPRRRSFGMSRLDGLSFACFSGGTSNVKAVRLRVARQETLS